MRMNALRTSMGWMTAIGVVSAASPARAKTLIDYFQPTPIVCPLTSNTWGAPGVVPRDVCNGLEDSSKQAQWTYWDGKILEGADGKFHMYAGRWPQSRGFGDWPNSVIVQADSNGTLIGSYVPSASAPFTGKEQNVTGMVLNDGSYALIDSPGNLFTASSLGGPWMSLGAIQITANGFPVSTQTTENQTIWQSANGGFLIISRTFQEMVSPKNILGPYVIQATIPGLQSQGYEDPVVWCSGGQYHLVANMYNARKAMHFTSVDGIHNWTNMGLAYDPTTNFVRYTDGTVNHWFKIERPGVFLQNGHVTAFSFSAIDVEKTTDTANSNHGSKIIVVPFDGLSFDRDNPGPGSAGCPLGGQTALDGGLDSGTPGAGGEGGSVGADGAGSLDSSPVTGSAGEAGDMNGSGNSGASSEMDAAGGTGSAGSAAGSSATGVSGAAGSSATGGSVGDAQTGGQASGSRSNGSGDSGASAASSASGCTCRAGAGQASNRGGAIALLVGVALAMGHRRRRGPPPGPVTIREPSKPG